MCPFRPYARALLATGTLVACSDHTAGRRPPANITGPTARQSVLALTSAPSAVGRWDPAPGFPNHVAIHAHLLPTGSVLFWPGEEGPVHGNSPKSHQFAFVWNPTSDTWREEDSRRTNVFCSGHAFLPDGRLLVAGGHRHDAGGRADVNIFDAVRGRWSSATAMHYPRWYPTSTTLANGEVLTVGGSRDTITDQVRTPEVRGADGRWRLLTGIDMVMPYYPWMFVAPNGSVFYAGPGPNTGYFHTAGAGSWQPVATTRQGALREYGTAVMYEPGKVLVIGGGGWTWAGNHPLPGPFASTEKIDLVSGGGWVDAGTMATARRHPNATILPDGRVLVTGGGSTQGAHNHVQGWDQPAEVWDPGTNSWTQWANMRRPRLYHSVALLLPDGRVLAAGGGRPAADGDGVDHPDADVFLPPYLFNPDGSRAAQPQIVAAPTAVGYNGQTFTIRTNVPVSRVTLVGLGSVTHAFNMNQRFLNLEVAGGGTTSLTVKSPASASHAPPGYYMLFALTAQGVPSVAKMLQVR